MTPRSRGRSLVRSTRCGALLGVVLGVVLGVGTALLMMLAPATSAAAGTAAGSAGDTAAGTSVDAAPGTRGDLADDPAAQQLADRYAPVVRMQAADESCDLGEQFQPTDVLAVLGDKEVALRGPWTPPDAIALAPEPQDVRDGPPGWFLDFPGNPLRPGCTYADWSARINAVFAPTVYAHVATDPGYPDQVVLQYWFFYVFNDYNNTHEGDWESIQIIFDAPSAEAALESDPVSVGYSQHGGAERALWGEDKLEIVDGSHPVVYPAAGSHANHYDTALYLGRGSEGLGCDDTTDPGAPFSPQVVLISEEPASVEAHPWVTFQGRWGERQESVFNGPTGPSQKGSWNAPIRSAEESWRDDSTKVPTGGLLGASATDAFCTAVKTGSNVVRQLLENPWLLVLALAAVAGLVWLAASRTTWRPNDPLPARARRGWGQCVTGTVRLFLDRPLLFAVLSLAMLPIGIASSVLARTQTSQPESGDLDAPTVESPGLIIGLLALTLSLVTVVLYVATLAAVSHILAELDEHRSVTTAGAFAHVAQRWRPLLAVTVTYAAVLIVLTALLVTIPVAVYYAVSRAYAIPAVIVERLPARQALRRSRDLVRGDWWPHAVALAIIVGIGWVTGPLLGILILLGTDLAPTLANIATAVAHAIALPLVALAITYLYFDGVARRDGDAAEQTDSPRPDPELSRQA